MDTVLIVVIAAIVAAVVLLLVAGWLALRSKHSAGLKEQFGMEYDYEVARQGKRSSAEKELDARRERVAELNIRPLTPDELEQFNVRWKDTQAGFVDDPSRAIVEADLLCKEVMEARGYPMGNFERRAADLSVDHSNVVSNYRAAHRIALEHAEGRADTEDLRRAMKHYRALFVDLLEAEPAREEARA